MLELETRERPALCSGHDDSADGQRWHWKGWIGSACKRGLDTGRHTVKAIVVTDQAAGTGGMTLVERPEPQAAINDIVVRVHASGFVPTELTWPSTWTDRLGRDRTPSIPGHELAGVVTAL